ncbi:MAG: hypothetical protein P1V51_02230 [Deltaproteobacteria bacterium]|nr:hypothetical protein [Deltaproteobacteria bacterium]
MKGVPESALLAARTLAAQGEAAPGRPRGPRALVCVVGTELWPALGVAAWVAPEQILLLRLARPPGDDGAPNLMEALARVCEISFDRIEQQWLEGEAEAALYGEVRDFLSRGKLDPARVVVDVSGADPLGRAAGALVAEAAGARLALLSGAEGEEQVRLLASPTRASGTDALARVREAFDGGRYADAEVRARELAGQLYEPREAEALASLAAGYGAWHRFDFEAAEAPLADFLELTRKHEGQGGWAWAAELRERVGENLEALRELRRVPERPARLEEGLPAILNHLAATHRAMTQVDLDDALLLLHGAVERWVDLVLRCEHALDPDDHAVIPLPDPEVEARFHALGEQLFEGYRPLPAQGPLLFRRAVQLLGALDADRITPGDLGWLQGLGHMRNALAHALVPTHPTAKLLQPKLGRVEAWFEGQLGEGALSRRLRRFTFPPLG